MEHKNTQVRNFVARDMLTKCKSKTFTGRNKRRAKDFRKSWKNEVY